jgi:hypothetical protein
MDPWSNESKTSGEDEVDADVEDDSDGRRQYPEPRR